MLKKSLLAALVLIAPAAYADPDAYTFDKDHTHVVFFINHLGFSNMVGRIKDYDGGFTFDENDPTKSTINVTLNPASVDTDVPKLNSELAGEKFFNAAKYPAMTFKSTKVVVTGKNTGDVTGDFTLLGVTKPVTLHVTYNKSGVHPFSNNYISGFTAEATLKRSDFGMSAYLPAVGDEVRVHIEVEGIDAAKHPGAAKTGNPAEAPKADK